MFPPNKCSKFLLPSLKSSIAEKGMGYAKVIQKKEENKRKKLKNGQVSKISKIMGTQMPAWKKRE